jgi:hypothetical protein
MNEGQDLEEILQEIEDLANDDQIAPVEIEELATSV